MKTKAAGPRPWDQGIQTWGRMFDNFVNEASKLDRDGIVGRAIPRLTAGERKRRIKNCDVIIQAFTEYRAKLESPATEFAP